MATACASHIQTITLPGPARILLAIRDGAPHSAPDSNRLACFQCWEASLATSSREAPAVVYGHGRLVVCAPEPARAGRCTPRYVEKHCRGAQQPHDLREER